MKTSNMGYCLSILLLTSIATSAESNETNNDESREPRVSGRIIKLYSGAKPEPYLCTDDGFQLDPSNCAAFYRCVKERSGKFTVFRYQCAPGTVYDPDLETCNHPRSTRRTECGGMLKPITEPHRITNINEIDGAQSELPRPISNNLPVYAEITTLKTSNTIPWILSTESKNPTKNPWTSTTDNSLHTLSANTKKSPHSTTVNQWLYSTQQRWELEYTSKSPPITTQHSPSKNNEPCISDGFMGDSENCRKFYRCVGNQRGTFIKYEFFCSKSTVWDDEIQGCNHPWAVQRSKCGRSMFSDNKSAPQKLEPGTVEESTVKESAQTNEQFGYKQNRTIQQQLQISHGPEVTQTQIQISSSADVIQNQTQINYGEKLQNNTNSKSKQNQTQISYGTAVSQTQTQIDYGTKGMQTQLQVDHSKDSSQSQVQIVDSLTHSTTGSSNNDGENECLKNGFMGDAYDCKKFYRCVDNGRGYTKYEFSCGDGTVWDPEIEACNHAWAVKECSSKQPTTEPHTTTPSKSTESHTEKIKTTPTYATNPVPDIDEEDNVGYANQNNLDATTTSTTSKKTTTAKLTTQKPTEPSTECTTSGFIGDTNDCQVFHRCVDNGNDGFIKFDFVCGDGTVWDPDIEACNHAWAVKNCGGTSSSSAVDNETTTKKETKPSENLHTTVTLVQISTQAPSLDEEYDTGYGSQNIEPLKTTTSEPAKTQQKQDSSVCQSSGFMGDSKNCKIFYRCVDNGNGGYIKYEFTCGQGTVWDPKIDACNHDWAVEKCEGSNDLNEITSYETTSQSSSITSSSTSNSTETTQVSKVTDTPKTTVSYGSTTTLSTDNKCSNSGFMGDSNNCKKFYRCVDNGDKSFIRYEFTCGEGTVWDATIEACNHAWAVKQCGGSGNGITDSQNESTTQATSGSIIAEGEQSQHSTEKLTTTTEAHKDSGTSVSDKCTQEGFYGDKKDCRKFYRCVNNEKGGFTKYEFICGAGTVWNQDIQGCDHASSDKSCSSSSSIDTTGPQTESTTSSSSLTSSTTTKTQGTTDETETSENIGTQCTSEGFFAHTIDCKKFIRCVDNGNGGYTRYEFSCGDGTIWVQEIQACDHDNDVNSCTAYVSSTTQASNTPSNSSNSSSSSVISSTESMPLSDEYDTQTSNEPSRDETDDCTSEGYFGNKQDCRKFYRCVNNGKGGYIKYDFVCGEGTAWDSDLQTCNHINGVQSCSGTTSNGNGNPQATTKKNEVELESTTSSTTKATSSTGSSINSQDICESEGYYGDSKNCKKFYRCVDNGKGGYTKYDFTCGEGTIWDQDITTCNHPQDVSNPSCNSSEGTSDPTSTTSSTTSSQTTLSTTEGSSSSSQSTSASSSKNPANNNVTCDKAGYYANPNDCKKFYRCVDWDGDGKRFSVFHFECGEGTIWDPALDTCNYEDSVYPPRDCSQTQSQNVGGETTTTDKITTSTTESTTLEQTTEEFTTTPQTSEKTTTEQTNESTSTQQTTTTSETTTLQMTTSEKTTTQESSTTEQSTTEQPMSSEKTTTQKSTTSEQTTTQQATTSEQTTTQQTTTSEKTTTEPTTTQQVTTSEQTTTEQTTTSEQTTTQQTATSEPAQESTSEQTATEPVTTEQSTTEQTTESTPLETSATEQTTTQLSSTSEETTTQQSTTSEHSTTTEQTTTQQTTTEQITESTTEQSSTTTEQSTDGTTTTDATTTEQVTESTTEQSSTTTEQSTDGTTTTDATTTEETNDQSTTQTSSTEFDSAEDSSSTTEPSPSDKGCPETEDDQYLLVCPTSFKRHPKYCNMFYQCTEEDDTYESKVAMFKCPNNTIYDESQTQCVTEDKADKKCEGEIANKRRFKRLGANYKEIIVADKAKQSCSGAGYFSFEKQSECAKGFLKCEKSKNGKLRGYVYQCPDGYVYWSISKRCERIESVRDCKRSSNDWTGRWNIPIERRNVAS